MIIMHCSIVTVSQSQASITYCNHQCHQDQLNIQPKSFVAARFQWVEGIDCCMFVNTLQVSSKCYLSLGTSPCIGPILQVNEDTWQGTRKSKEKIRGFFSFLISSQIEYTKKFSLLICSSHPLSTLWPHIMCYRKVHDRLPKELCWYALECKIQTTPGTVNKVNEVHVDFT